MRKMRLALIFVVAVMLVLTAVSCGKKTTEPDEETVATPTFSPPEGTYTSAQNVSISCATPGATVYYSIDGSAPSTRYTGPVTIASTATLKAKATKSGWTDSQIASANYTINITPDTVATPTFSPPEGTYTSAQNVSISCATPGATIHYTTNGTEPTADSPTYSSPINVSSTTTIKAKGIKDGWTPSSTASATYTINAFTPGQMVLVYGGSFHNDTSDVTISSFYIGKYELTQAEYQAVMGNNPSEFTDVTNGPVERVSWFYAIIYCNRRSVQEGLTPCYSYLNYGTNPDTWPFQWHTNSGNHTNISCNWGANGYRLPTEMEWMFAAKGGNQSQGYTYSGSNYIDAVAWYWDNAGETTHTVGSKAANELGIYDMSGNVWELVWDIYDSYPSEAQTDPHGATSGPLRVRRGGCLFSRSDTCTVSYRGNFPASCWDYSIGFRICRVSP